ncbi:hypothetical protein R1sor_024378 [Riccia sorocarpa]|uniref:Reverse transcriptase n=1 Tax=Riccia sorocarpa TaxID=122646 RepID=A0ABD3GQC1_9MARC
MQKREEHLQRLQGKLREAARNRQATADPELTKVEEEVDQLEKKRTKLWRRWSKIRWIAEGDAPSKFFFAQLKARRAKEAMSTLITDDGRKLEDDSEIMEELHKFYSNLYKQPEVSEADRELRSSALQKVTNKVDSTQNKKLAAIPAEDEIGTTVRALKADKSPGADGMTAELLQILWREKKQDVLDFVYGPQDGALVKRAITKGNYTVASKEWSVTENLLTSCPVRIANCPIASGMLTVWNKARKKLKICKEEMCPKGDAGPELLTTVSTQQGWTSKEATLGWDS